MTRITISILALLAGVSGCDGSSKVVVGTPDSDRPIFTVSTEEAQIVTDELAGVNLSGDELASGDLVGDSNGPLLDNVGERIALPEKVENVRAMRYSATAGELFWSAAPDASTTTRYEIHLDGVFLDTASNFSFFTESLSAGVAHELSVSALDAYDQASEPVVVRINDQIDIPPPNYEFAITVDRARANVDEGNVDGATFVITAAPEGLETISLSVQPDGSDDAHNMSVSLGEGVLNTDNQQTTLNFQLSVGQRPLYEHERLFTLVAKSGDEVRQVELSLDIKPIDAPDIYLLIGQSNMVGNSLSGDKQVYSGGLDERSSRILQLNVAPNSRQIFAGFPDFSNEASNAIEPRYIEAEDPLHDPRNPIVEFKGGTSIGPGLSFAKAALNATTKNIFLVPAAWGATGFCQTIGFDFGWNAVKTDNVSLAGTGLLERALTRLNMTMRDTGGVLRGIIWHQGGADSNSQACADTYQVNLQLMVERLRRDAREDPRGPTARGSLAPIPFVVATQSRGKDERSDFSKWPATKSQVDTVQRNVSNIVPYSDWVNNDDLVPPAYPCGSTSCVHFGALANREIGRRMFDAIERIWSRDM